MTARILNLGRQSYLETWEIQKELCEKIILGEAEDTLIFVEHDPVLTLGASFHEENLLLTADEYRSRGIEVIKTDRGGDVTFHGPNQLVIYPIFNVASHGKDLHKWMRSLEETIIRACAEFGLEAGRFAPNTGVWIDGRKTAAIGVKMRKWVNLHGIAVNCDNDLEPFDLIVPCGIQGHGVTSLSAEAGRKITKEDVQPAVERAFEDVFNLELKPAT
jgi:lipoyl(octanoyl) transferase